MEQQQRITRVIAEQLGLADDAVKPDSRFVADFGADSLDEIELVMALEAVFGIEIDDERAERVVTVADAFDLIASMVPAA